MVKYRYEKITNPKERKNFKYRIFKETKRGFEVVRRTSDLNFAKRFVKSKNKK